VLVMADNTRAKPAGKPPAESKDKEPGRVAEDDRGNMSWQWSDDEGDLLADDDVGKAERLRALNDPKLDFQDEPDNPNAPVQNNTRGLKSGYNPYNSGALGKSSWKKKKDLHKLSDWIELRKKLEKKKSEDE
jgi:hypothetical protein